MEKNTTVNHNKNEIKTAQLNSTGDEAFPNQISMSKLLC
jgi:hypothetical protein